MVLSMATPKITITPQKDQVEAIRALAAAGRSPTIPVDFAGVGDFAVVVDAVLSTDGDDGAGRLFAESPAKHVHVVHAKVGDLAARVVIEPTEIVERPVRIVSDFRGGAEPLVPHLRGGRNAIGRISDPVGRFVLNVKTEGDADLTEGAGLNVVDRFLKEFGGPALDADLDNALGFGGDLNHAAAFGHREGKRLFDVDVLTGAAGVNEHQGVPMVRTGDGDGFDVLVFEELPVIFVARGIRAGFDGREDEVVVAEVADGDGAGVAVFKEAFVDLIAAIAEPDETHLETAVGSEDAGIAEGGGGKEAAVHVMLL